MSNRVPGRRPLEAWPCQSTCDWSRTREVQAVDDAREHAAVFRCRGCGSEWVVGTPWTPVDTDGQVPADVAAALAGDAARPGPTSEPCGGAADSGDT